MLKILLKKNHFHIRITKRKSRQVTLFKASTLILERPLFLLTMPPRPRPAPVDLSIHNGPLLRRHNTPIA